MPLPDLPKENIYGHTKKLKFILHELERFVGRHGKPVTLLDFGCGNGTAVSRFLIQEGIRYYGVDIHEPSLEYAREHLANEYASFHSQLPQDVQFDVIVYADILEHIDDPVLVLQQHHRLLKTHGIVLGSVPNGYGPFEIEKWLTERADRAGLLALLAGIKAAVVGRSTRSTVPGTQEPPPPLLPYNIESGHVQFFSKRSLRTTLEQGGFKASRFKNGAFVGAPYSERLLLHKEWMSRLNVAIADYLPYWAVSTWYFTAVKKGET